MNDPATTATHLTEKEIFFRALDEPTTEARNAYLDRTCAGHPDRRAVIESLLAHHADGNGFMAMPAVGGAPDSPLRRNGPADEGPGTVLGRYRLLEKIGEGGFGDVYMAEQDEPVKRRVALKIIKLGMDTRQVVARFEVERQALALMDHPNIAKVFDAGTTSSGRPFFVMELVRGTSITRFCDENQSTLKERLELFIPVCLAIQHAHQKGVLHRDIKPSNILVTLHDGVPVPMVIDFGIAKATEQELTERTVFTLFHQMVGTPAYMSPEQAEMSGLDIDTRSDIYSLGVLLYELLTGRTPLDTKSLLAGGLDAVRREIVSGEPVRPSTRARSLEGEERTATARRRGTDPVRLGSELKGDLDWIALKALEKDRTRRYQTANGLALDLRRFLRSEPVEAAAPSTLYHLRKFLVRHRTQAVAAGVLAAVLLGALAIVLVVQGRANRFYRQRAYQYDIHRADAALHAGQFGTLEAILEDCPSDLRHWEWRYLQAQRGRWSATPFLEIPEGVESLLLSPDGSLLAVADTQGTLHMIDFPGRTPRWKAPLATEYWKQALAFGPGSRSVAMVSDEQPEVVEVRDARTGELRARLPHAARVACLAFSPDRVRLFTGGPDLPVTAWNLASEGKPADPALGAPPEPGPGATIGMIDAATSFSFSSDGRTIIIGHHDGRITFADPDSGAVSRELETGPHPVIGTRLTTDGRRLVSSQSRPHVGPTSLKLWDLEDGSSRDLHGVESRLLASGGPWIAVQGGSLLDAASGEPVALLPARREGFGSVSVHPDGRLVTAIAGAGTVQVLTLNHPGFVALRGHQFSLRHLAFDPRGGIVASCGLEADVRLWNVGEERFAGALPGDSAHHPALAWSPEGRFVVVAGRSPNDTPELVQWNVAGRKRGWTARFGTTEDEVPWWLAASPDGRRLLSASSDGVLRLWDARTGVPLGDPIRVAEGEVDAVLDGADWSNDGRLVAVCFKNRAAVWEIGSRREVWRTPVSADRCIRFSPDGERVVHGSMGGELTVRDAADGRAVQLFERHSGPVKTMVWSPDGERLFSGGADGTVRVWDVRSGEELLRLEHGGRGTVWSLDLSQDGRTLGAAGDDGTVTLWKTE